MGEGRTAVVVFLLLALIGVGAAGCDDKTACEKHCSMFNYAWADRVENDPTMGLYETDIEGCIEDCVSICSDCLSELEASSKKQIKKCTHCVYERVGGKPSWSEFHQTFGGKCESYCLTDDYQQEFLVCTEAGLCDAAFYNQD